MSPLIMVAGKVIALVFVKANDALALLATIFPEVLVGEFPESVNVFAPTVSVPLVKVKSDVISKL